MLGLRPVAHAGVHRTRLVGPTSISSLSVDNWVWEETRWLSDQSALKPWRRLGVGGRAYPGADTYPSTTISGSPFSYDSGNGNLLVEIFGLGQSNICNGCGNS
jgi:hypothetical protein